MANILIEIPFSGNYSDVDQFYEVLGVDVKNGYLTFGDADICFGNIENKNIRFVISINKDLSIIESKIKECKGEVLEKGFDIAGPFLIVRDPAGVSVRIEEDKTK